MLGGRKHLVLAALAFLLASLALSPRSVRASPGWDVILDRPTPNFGAVDFVSDSEGWMTAGAGLLHTTDGGATWAEASPLAGNDVDFADADHGWLVGLDGSIFRTSDGGVTWNAQASGTRVHLYDIEAISAQEGWAVGRGSGYSDVIIFPTATILLHTTDGGVMWQSVDLPPNSEFSEIAFAGSSGWALGRTCTPPEGFQFCNTPGDASIIRTTDGGMTWTSVPSVPNDAHDMDFVDSQQGWLLGTYDFTEGRFPAIFHTEDGGLTWERQSLVAQHFDSWLALDFRDTSTGWVLISNYLTPIGAANMHIAATSDGGASWTEAGSLHVPGPQGQGALDARAGALYVTGYGVAYRSTDGGITWQPMRHRAIQFDALQFIDAHTGFAVSVGNLFRTDDAGLNWERVGAVPSAFPTLEFLDSSTGFLAGMECANISCYPAVYHTASGGRDWTRVYAATPADDSVVRLEFLDRQRGWLVTNLAFVVTTDGGATWEERPLGALADFVGAADLVDATHAWAVTQTCQPALCEYALIRSDDAARTWQIVRSLTQGTEFLQFTDVDRGWYFGIDCTDTCVGGIFATTDGGVTWERLNVDASGVTDMVFVDLFNGWLSVQRYGDTGYTSDLLHTADGGRTWVSQLAGDLLFGNLEFAGVANGWLALAPYRGQGIGGGPPNRTVLYHTTDAGGGPIGGEPDLPDVGTGVSARSDLALPLLLVCAAMASFATAIALQRRRRP